MSAPDRNESVDRMVAAAERAIVSIRYCWLATSGGGALVNARPMGRTAPAPGDDPWLVRFVTDARSRKFAEIAPGAEVCLVFQRDADDCYLALSGAAAVSPRASADPRLWRRAYDVYFPGPGEREHAAFVEVAVTRMELWMRGVTPEPFGLKPTALARDVGGAWRLNG